MDVEKIVDGAIELAVPISGEIVGEIVGGVLAGVPGIIAGKFVGTTLGFCLKIFAQEIKERVLSEREKKNIKNVLYSTVSELSESDIKKKSNVEIDEDWLVRFFNIVKDVSSKDIQMIWAKILTNQIKGKNKSSLRMLETLKNVDKEEAKIFEKIRPFIFYNKGVAFLPNNKKLLSRYDLQYNDLLRLDECGFINARGDLSLTFDVSNSIRNVKSIMNKDRLLGIVGMEENIYHLQVSVYPLTTVGNSLFFMLNTNANLEYTEAFCHEIVDENKGKVCVHLYDFTVKKGDLPLLKKYF